MEIQARQLLVAVFGIVIAIGFANAVQAETAPPVVVGLARCSDCARRNMNAETAFKGLQVAVKCKNSKGEYESTAVGQVDKSGAFRVPLAADVVVGEDGELKPECFAQLHSASSAPCPGQEPSKIVAAPPGHVDGNGKTFVALGGKVYRSSPECASAFLCHPFFHSIVGHHHVGTHIPVVVPHLPDHGHGHSVPHVTKPPAVDVPEHKPGPVPVPEHKPPAVDVPEHKPGPVPVPEHKPPAVDVPEHKPGPVPVPEHKPPAVDVPEHKPGPVPVPEHKPPSTPAVDVPEHKPAPVPVPEHKPPSTPAVDVPEHKPAPVPMPEHKPPSTPAVDVPEHKPAPVPVPEHKPPSTPANDPPSTPTAPSTPVYSPPKPTPIYHPPAQRDAVTGP